MVKGIDISSYQGNVDMEAVKNAGYSFVVAKASEGLRYRDKTFAQNIANAKATGLLAGAYHFARFTDSDGAISEAEFFLSVCTGAKPDFLVLDFEQKCSGNMTGACLAFLDRIASVAPAIIYCNPSYISSYLNSAITKYPLWVAHYGVATPKTPLWGTYAMWQYSESGQVAGITDSKVDLNVMAEDFYNSLKGGGIELKNIVGFNNQVDKRAAEYLADFLNCPTVDMVATASAVDFTKVSNVYFVGGGNFPSLPNCKVIKGADRYDTLIEVLKNMGKLK